MKRLQNNTKVQVTLILLIIISVIVIKFLHRNVEEPTGIKIDTTAIHPTRFRVVSYNVENLFDIVDNPDTYDDDLTPAGKLHWTEERYLKKVEDISKVLTAVGEGEYPSVVGLCEIENESVLMDLVQSERLEKNNYKYIISTSKDSRGVNLALLYSPKQFRVIDTISYRPNIGEAKPKYSRDILHVSGTVANKDTLDFFVCHFPSRGGGKIKTEPSRTKAARVLKQKTDSTLKLRKNPNIIIMGDFNDYPYDNSTSKIMEAKSVNYDRWSDKYYNLFLHVVTDPNLGSYKYNGTWGYLDQFIVSGNLLISKEGTRIKDNKAQEFSADFMLVDDEKHGGKKPFRTYSGYKYLGGISDHLPIYMDLEMVKYVITDPQETP